MRTRASLKSAGLVLTEDGFGVHSVRLGEGVPARVARITRLAGHILADVARESRSDGIEIAALCVFDAVLPSDLSIAASGMAHVYTWRDLRLLEWRAEKPPRWERRALHPTTIGLLHAEGLLLREVSVDLHGRLCTYLDRRVEYAEFKRVDRVLEFERDLICCWYQCLPMPLFFHLVGAQPLSAVSRACLACADHDLVPVPPPTADELEATEFADDNSCAELLDMVHQSSGQDSSAIVLKQALDVVSMYDSETDAVAKRRWIAGLLGLRMLAVSTGPVTSLLLAWAVDLIESGTARQPNPPKKTVYEYLRRALLPLFEALREMSDSPDTWAVEVLASIYQVLVATQSAGNQGTMASAMTSFHRFLQEWYDAPPLRRPLHADVPLPEARAIVIWPQRLAMARAWVPQLTDDPLLADCIQVVLAIAGEAPSRAKEILFLRLGNVIDHGHCIEIEIAPSWRTDRLKTAWSQRRLWVRDAVSKEIIRKRVAKVEALRSGPRTLLFADPADPRSVYRRAQISQAVARLLRASTGDPQAVGHSLRHAAISLAIEPSLRTSSIWGIDRFRVVAVDAGHATGTTTLVSYTHLYEGALRTWLDAALTKLVPLKSHVAAKLGGLSEAALRKRASRLKSNTSDLGWLIVRESASPIKLPEAADAFEWMPAQPPVPIARSRMPFGPGVTLMLLARMVGGASPDEAADAFLMERADLGRLNGCALRVIKVAAACIWPRRVASAKSPPVTLGDALGKLGLRLGNGTHRKLAVLYEWLQVERPTEVLEAAVRSWLVCRRGEYLALDEPRAIAGLYRLLSEAGSDPALLRVGLRGEAFKDEQSELRRTVERDFLTAFGVRPRVFPAAPRDRVAKAYLQLDAPDTMERQHGRAGSLAGLDLLLVAIAIHLEWRKGGTE